MERIRESDTSVEADDVNTSSEHSCACAHPTSAIQRLNAGSHAPRRWECDSIIFRNEDGDDSGLSSKTTADGLLVSDDNVLWTYLRFATAEGVFDDKRRLTPLGDTSDTIRQQTVS